MKKYFGFLILILLVTCCTMGSKRITTSEGRLIEVFAKNNTVISSIIAEKEFKTILMSFSFENSDSLLQVIPLENNCIPSSKKDVYFFEKDEFLFIITDTITLNLVFNSYTVNPVLIKKRCKFKVNCIENDCPIMLFSYGNGQFEKIKGFYW